MKLNRKAKVALANLVLACALNQKGDRRNAARLFTKAALDEDAIDEIGEELVNGNADEDEFVDALTASSEDEDVSDDDDAENDDYEDEDVSDDEEEDDDYDEEEEASLHQALASLAGSSPTDRASRSSQRTHNQRSVQVANARARKMSRHR